MRRPIPEAVLTWNPETGFYGFSALMPGHGPHYEMEQFRGRQDALNWLDPWRERIWEEADESVPGLLAISRGYRPNSVPMLLAEG